MNPIDLDTRRRVHALEKENAFLRQKLFDVLDAPWRGLGPMAAMNACDALDHPIREGAGECYCRRRKEVKPTTN